MLAALRRRVARVDGATRMLLAALAGAALASGQAPVSWPFAVFPALVVLLWMFDASAGWRATFGIGWLAGAGYFTATLFWIVEPFLVDPERYGWMAPFALAGMAGGLALFWAVPFALAGRVGRSWDGGRRVIVLVCLWTLSEVARAYVLTGFPWALIGYAWIETPLMQLSRLVGPHGLGFLTLLVAVALATCRPGPVALACLLTAGCWAWGWVQLGLPIPARDVPVVVRVVQPNAPQRLKWEPGMQEMFYRRLLAATGAPADPAPDLTIWPETAVPFVLGYSDDLLAETAAAPGGDGLVMLGLRRLEIADGREHWYNSLAVLRPDGTPWAVYDKHHLVPFGEYLPMARTIGRLGVAALAPLTQTGFQAGTGPRLVSVPGLPPFLPLICYEAIFPQGMRAPEGRAEWLVQITNDAWFGSLAGPYQHLAQARARAIEQGLPLVRSANTGISAMIDPRGRVLDELALGTAGYFDASLPPPLPRTLYATFGDLPVVAFVLTIIGLTFTNLLDGLFLVRHR